MCFAAVSRTAAVFSRWLCCAFVFLFSCSVWASDAAGVSWLQAQVQVNGSLAQEGASVALPLQSRAETATTLKAFVGTISPQLLNAVQSAGGDAVEITARKALTELLLSINSTTYLNALLLQQNADGGFGAVQGYASNVQDTAWALSALNASAGANTGPAGQAVAWLLDAQQLDGSWNLSADSDDLIPTALAIQALQPYRQTAVVASALSKARSWLLSERNSMLTWGNSVRNAHALAAVLPGLTNAATVQVAVDGLRAAQRPDGSWDADPYTTALALRASSMARQPVTDPDLTSVKGVLVNSDTGLPLAGAQVRLSRGSLAVVTDAQGRFEFLQLDPGTHRLTIDASGYLSLSADLGLLKGQQLDLGVIRLKTLTPSSASTVNVSGVAKFTADGVSYQPAANATVSVGKWSTQTNANGEYALEGLLAGAMDLKASYLSYEAVEVSFSALAGQQVRLDPVFRRSAAQGMLKVVVRNQVTGAGIGMASVSLNGLIRNTNAKGETTFDVGIVAGDNTVAVTASGFEIRIITMKVQGNQTITLPVTLTPQSAILGQTVLQGVVSDASTRLPLPGVTVAVDGTGRTAITDAAGRYTIAGVPDIAGSRTISMEKAGYQRFEQTITLVKDGTHQFDLPLYPSINSQQPIAIRASVTDKATHQPVTAATVTLSGSNPHVVQTNAQGVAEISGLNVGATQVQVSAQGYDSVAFSVNLAVGTRYELPVELVSRAQGPNRIHGVVLNAQSQRPVAGAKVVLAGANLLETTSGADGSYEFVNITPGRWNISATSSGYQGTSSGFDIASSTATNLPLQPDFGLNANSTLQTVAVGHPNLSNAAIGYMFIFGEQGTTGQVVSNDGAINYSFVVDATGVVELMVPSDRFLNEPGKVVDKALLVYANKGVSAYFLNREMYSTDMSYLLDTTALGSEYRIVDWYHSFGDIQFSITAVEDGTVATITPVSDLATGQRAKQPFDVKLQKGQSVIYTTFNEITGTHIQANKPLAVFAGTQCSNVTVYATACDHLFTQLPPVKHWSSEYVVPKTANTGTVGNLVRIVANTPATQVSVDGALVATLNPGEFHQLTNAQSFHLVASAPVLVGQFLKGSSATTSSTLGDPALTYVGGIDQTLSEYVFTAPTNLSPFKENYLNIAVPTTALNSLQLNGVAVNVSAFAPVGASGYSVGQVPIPTGPGRIKAAKPFLATIAGFSYFDSYLTIIGAKYSAGASPANIRGSVSVSTDKPSYPADTAVQLRASVLNLGMAPTAFTLALRITDATGIEVAQFAEHDMGDVAAGASVPYTKVWSTARYPAGAYTLIATLLNAKGEVVDIGSALFSIKADVVQGAGKAALTVAVDKAEYAPNDRVRISNLARNLTVNAPVDNARVRITVRNPSNAVVYTYTHVLGQLQAGGLWSNDTQQALQTAMEGTYTVEAVLIGSGNNLKSATVLPANLPKAYDMDVSLATATANYVVRANPALAPGAPGAPGAPAGPGAPGMATPVPVNDPWFLWLISVLLVFVATYRLRANARQPSLAQHGRSVP
ncbi:MAG: hypothetical protein EON54_05060 [Alcaligenaceae bacterium]|nr:MAG: hypothetical protein EON54_05060 [Alcaligenaceae bacterium]